MNRKPWNLRVCVLTILWALALTAAPFASAQLLNVSGTVSDPTGETLIGVSVSVKGDQTHAIATGIDGDYTCLSVQGKVMRMCLLRFRLAGMITLKSLTR